MGLPKPQQNNFVNNTSIMLYPIIILKIFQMWDEIGIIERNLIKVCYITRLMIFMSANNLDKNFR